MTEDDLRWTQLRSIFRSELEERVRNLNGLLLRLEREDEREQTRAEILGALSREIHSLKGAARAVESGQIERLAHAFETALAEVQGSQGRPVQVWFDAAYRAIDALLPLSETNMTEAPDFGTDRLVEVLEQQSSSLPAAVYSGLTADADRRVAKAVANEAQGATGLGTPHGSTEPARNDETVRVAVEKLDLLLAQTGELTVANMRIEQRVDDVAGLSAEIEKWRRSWRTRREEWTALRQNRQAYPNRPAEVGALATLLRFADEADAQIRNLRQQVDAFHSRLRADSAELRLVSSSIEDEVLAARLMPVSTVFTPFERMVRDLARDQSKEVRLIREGGDVEVDRRILEQLRDPLMHMIRNAVDHGLELPEDREARGKPRQGTITLSAFQRGGAVEIRVEDDGAGIDVDALRRAAVRTGQLSEEQAQGLSQADVAELIFQPGVSTSQAVTQTSGRGVGMDVVRDHLNRLNGTIVTTTATGSGTRFVIAAPLSLATTRALLVEEDGKLFAIPSTMVERAARVRQSDIRRVEGRTTINECGQPLQAVELASILELPAVAANEWRTYLILRQDARRVALLTGRLAGEQEMVVKRLGWPLHRVRNVTGAAVLGSGQIALILNPADLVRSAMRLGGLPGDSAIHTSTTAPVTRRRSRVLVVDDSLTTRMLERGILESAGYDTLVAANGVEALNLLRDETVDLVLSDVEMPELDGFGLTSEIRRTERLREIPVILLTSMEKREQREQGMEAGADAYLIKSGFEQTQLLDAVGRLL